MAAIARVQNNKMRFPWQSSQSCASNVEKKRAPNPMPEVCVTSVQGKLVSFNIEYALFINLLIIINLFSVIKHAAKFSVRT